MRVFVVVVFSSYNEKSGVIETGLAAQKYQCPGLWESHEPKITIPDPGILSRLGEEVKRQC